MNDPDRRIPMSPNATPPNTTPSERMSPNTGRGPDRRGPDRRSSRRPTTDELREGGTCGNAYQRSLIDRAPGDCVLQALDDQLHWLCNLSCSLSTEQVDRIHPPYAWTVRQVFEHCVDAERVFGGRILWIAAGDPTEHPSWDENAFAASRFGLGNFGHLVSEFAALRQANLLLLRRIIPRAWDRTGKVGGQPLSVRAIAWIAVGHLHHHFEIVEQRCGVHAERTPDRTPRDAR